MPLKIIKGDITRMKVDAVVNAANSSLQRGGGVCGAIFAAAGEAELQAECNKIGRCATGEAVITGGYRLPARYIIHTVGPVWQGGSKGERELLYRCYTNSLKLAKEKGCRSIAFPLISAGIFGYPKKEALEVAVSAIGEFLKNYDMEVYLVLLDEEAINYSRERFSDLWAK
ncbi:O-acetyl-ADP-ribose deacetylase (regulator of RNase III), contains Macro domain [Thermosyntropha lipolytica DSM 11003]|uniref:O-acetyl-ADP-ribose deacetylase (Regulator of RNase III), contains Macro domain n=1 Tax=Thermosyntropha lipolytica DSM 11003 TaxID=1123382 RepID=A0A1M5QLG3_9FIRM|nr:macro domain-containing protein [Thermosyntropha lipolytica]SHH14443.1 O-acetyl-ADP-ribose deacetylase (regulator of RNase III), contains Macro domain [Thermosyntropha lipolytica DSM 11003]